MQIPKKVIFILGAIAMVVYFWQIDFAQAEDFSEDNLQFCVEGGKIYFFQPQTGRIFVYQTTTNRFSRLLTLEKLGEDLKQTRSLSSVETGD